MSNSSAIFLQMTQGKLKKKVSSVAKKPKPQKKSLGPRKGGRAIQPKKHAKSNVRTVKKKLEVQIKATIETQVVEQAKKFEHKPLKVVKKPSGASGKKKAKGKKKANKK